MPPELSSPVRDALTDYIRCLQADGTEDVLLSQGARKVLLELRGGAARKETIQKATAAGPPLQAEPKSGSVKPLVTRPAAVPVAEWRPEIEGNGKREQLEHLASRARECLKCPHLAASRTQVVFGVGNPEAQLMFVGEAPGADEDKMGEPFVGAAGQLLTKMIAAMGLSRPDIYIGNVLKCRPDMPPGASGNRKPTPQEMKTCLPYIAAQIDIIRPKALVALGATAVEGLLGEKTPISKLRGRFLDFRGIPVMATYHPAYLLRNQSISEKRKVWEDLLQVMEKLELPISDKQRGYFK